MTSSAMTEMLRGRIYRAHLTRIGEDKYFLVVSNNRRAALGLPD